MKLKFEKRNKKPATFPVFLQRLSVFFAFAVLLIFVSLLAGMLGYRIFEGLPWVDCFANASMILGGMGELDPLKTNAGKIFAGIYALYSGLLVIACMGLILTPVIHRVLHTFHAEDN